MTPDANLARLVAELFSAYPMVRVEMSTVEMYERRLAKCDREALADAIERLIDTSPKLPAISDIREAVSAIIRQREMRARGMGGLRAVKPAE